MNLHAMPTALAEYLLRLDRSLWGIPASRRNEILREVGDFLGEDLSRARLDGVFGFHRLLETHGSPEAMGRTFRRAHWKDRCLGMVGGLVPVAASLVWMVFLGLFLGVEPGTPGYLSFLMDFPSLMLVLVVVRSTWSRAPRLRRLLLGGLTGLATGVIVCAITCGDSGPQMLQHAIYPAFFGLVLERAMDPRGLRFGILDVALFMLFHQLNFMLITWQVAPMTYGCMAYHLLNALGIELVVWAGVRGFHRVRQWTSFLQPES